MINKNTTFFLTSPITTLTPLRYTRQSNYPAFNMSKKELDHHKRLPEPFNDREVPTFNTFKVEALRRGVGYVVDVSKARCSAQVSLLPSDYKNLTPGRLKEFDLVRTRLLDTAEWALDCAWLWTACTYLTVPWPWPDHNRLFCSPAD